MSHDIVKVLVSNLTAFAVMTLFNRWRKGASHIGAYIVTMTVVWAWFDGRWYGVQAVGCILGVILIGAEMSGKLTIKRLVRSRQPRDQ